MALYVGAFVHFLRAPANSIQNDSAGYLQLAYNLRHHHVFSQSSEAPYAPDFYRLPVYPLVLALLNVTSASHVWPAIALQCALGIALLFLGWPLFLRYGGERGALCASVFLCMDWVAFWHTPRILTEALFLTVLTMAMVLALRSSEGDSWRAYAAAIAYGVAALIKPLAIFLAMVYVAATFRRRWKETLLLTCLALALPASWVMRNWYYTGHPLYTVQGGFVLLLCPASSALAMDTGMSQTQAFAQLNEEIRSENHGEDLVAQSRAAQRKALEVMRQHLGAALRYHAYNLLRILAGTGIELPLPAVVTPSSNPLQDTYTLNITGGGTLKVLKAHPTLWVVQIAYSLILLAGYIAFGLGLRRMFLAGKVRESFYIALSIMMILAISAHQGYYRFRIPLLPFLALGIAASFAANHRGRVTEVLGDAGRRA